MLSRGLRLSSSALRSTNIRTFLTDMVRVVEVGPRDGLQNIKKVISSTLKIDMINKLADAGLKSIEVTSLVPAKWVPQMADAPEVIQALKPRDQVDYSVLVPNIQGLQRAIELGVREVLFVTSASEGFARANLNCSVEDALVRISDMSEICKDKGIKMRGSISCCIGCPFDGETDPKRVADIAERLFKLGCFEISIADTIGVGTPRSFAKLFNTLKISNGGDIWRFAVHCHDTYGQALSNIYECLNQGIRVFDSSVAGLGGCPYAPGATGNVASEDLVYLLHGQGMATRIDLDKLIKVGHYVTQAIPTANCSKVGNAVLAKESCQQKT